jgi:hypothetical protein
LDCGIEIEMAAHETFPGMDTKRVGGWSVAMSASGRNSGLREGGEKTRTERDKKRKG